MLIGKLARKFDLSRSTLLYYDRIGLLKASGRTPSNYRTYTRSDVRRLEKICLFRQAGMDLKTIAATLRISNSSLVQTLEQQIGLLNQKIQTLRRQQHLIVRLLKEIKGEDLPIKVMDKDSWVRLLKSAGMDENAMGAWHQAFEQLSPDVHQHFLESLGLPAAEVKAIRCWSQTETPD
jgi:MerR family transcriptional regulator, thiopeptide resistance regulator